MERILKIASILFAVIMISGCLAKQAIIVAPNDKPLDGYGYFVVSVSFDGGGDSTLLYRKQGETNYTRVDAVGFLKAKSELGEASSPGRVFAVKVPPGAYEISGFGIYVGSGWYFAKELPALKFIVKNNESVYLGNMHVVARYGENRYGRVGLNGAYGYFKPNVERDIKVYKNKYKNLHSIPLRYDLLTDSEWDGKRVTN